MGAACSLTEADVIPENTIIYGSQCQRREMNDKPYVNIHILSLIYDVKSGCNAKLFSYFSLKSDSWIF